MNLETIQAILAILKEVGAIIQALKEMGVRVDGTVKLDQLTALLHKPNAG